MTAEHPRKRVAVVGGGITGLTAAYQLRDSAVDVTLFEASDRLGGKIRTERVAGVPVDAGADWFITRQPAALELCRELGLDDRLVTPARSGTFLWTGGRLVKLIPEQVRGVPTHPFKAMSAGLLTRAGALRAAAEALSPRPLTGPDVSVGTFVHRRFGSEVLDRLVDPLLAASRSGGADEMSLAAAAPELDAAARSNRSTLVGLRKKRSSQETLPPFFGLEGGMSTLVEALHARLGDTKIEPAAPIRSIERTSNGYTLTTSRDARVDADAVILALPANVSSTLLSPLDDELGRKLAEIRYDPGTVVTLAFDASSLPTPPGTGVLIPTRDRSLLTAFAWFSEKWPHARPASGYVIVRCFVGADDLPPMDDAQLVSAVTGELAEIAGVRARPVEHHVTRWERALPVYRVGHKELADSIEGRLRHLPGLLLAGAGYRGSGLPDCISDGRRAADAVREHLAANSG
jgi:protoporphyrinogen/coproporphyrinogen III oxidase